MILLFIQLYLDTLSYTYHLRSLRVVYKINSRSFIDNKLSFCQSFFSIKKVLLLLSTYMENEKIYIYEFFGLRKLCKLQTEKISANNL